MKRFLILFLTCHLSLLVSMAQPMKPCGTSVLARKHMATEKTPAKSRPRQTQLQNAFVGEKRGLIILVDFPDVHFQDDNPISTWMVIANQEGYADNGAIGSISDYFHDQSYGQFQLTFDVFGPVEAAHEHAYYGQNIDWGEPTGWFDQNVAELVEEACLGVADQVQFSDYDWDGDGIVEQVFLLYAGYGENDYWSKDSTVIWPHMSTLSLDWEGYEEGIQLQGVRIDTYACSNEINRSGSLVGIGTFCHEFSHCLGLPDMYNTKKGVSVLGRYDLMDQGCYNGNCWCPVGYSSYERYVCGWLIPTAIDVPPEVEEISFLDESPDAGIYRVSDDANDYYLIEKREKKGWDTYLPTEGLFAWHIDYDEEAWTENTVNNDPDHLRVERLLVSQTPLDIHTINTSADYPVVAIYDLCGRRLSIGSVSESLESPALYLIRYSDGTIKKVFR